MVEGREPRDNGEGTDVLGVICPIAEGGEHFHDLGIRERAVIGDDGECAVRVFRDCSRVDLARARTRTVAESPFGSLSMSVISGVS